MGNPIFIYEKFELLVCIYEISRALVFKYVISGCSRCLTLVTTVNPIPFQVQMRYLFPIQLNQVSPCKYQYTRSLWKVCLFCRTVHLGQYMYCNREHSKYFDKIIPLRFWNWLQIDFIDLDNNGIFPLIKFKVEVSYNMFFSELGIN